MTYSLIIPIYNEERTLSALLKKLDRLGNNIEIIIIDDGSDDGTKIMLKNQKRLNVLRNESNIGKGASIKKGLEIAKNKNIILMDGDLEVDSSDISRLINKFENYWGPTECRQKVALENFVFVVDSTAHYNS